MNNLSFRLIFLYILLLFIGCGNKQGVNETENGEEANGSNQTTPKYSGAPRLVKIDAVDTLNGKTKLSIQVEGKGIEIGSFYIRLDAGTAPEGEGFFQSSNGYWYLNGGTVDKPSPNIFDNSSLDEDRRKGFFAHTFDMRSWPDSLNGFLIGWHNRPDTGPYKTLSAQLVLVNGKPFSSEFISNVPDIQHNTIYMESGGYAAFPELFVLDGKYKIGTSFGVNYSRTHLDGKSVSHRLISNDGGKTWNKTNDGFIDLRWKKPSGVIEIPSAQGWVYADPSEYDKLVKEKKIVSYSADGRIAYLGGAHVRTSTDNGKTWQTKDLTIPENCSGLMNHHTSSSYIITSSGIQIRAIYGPRKEFASASPRKDEIYFIRSDDDGETWSVYPMFEEGVSGLEVSGFNETAIIEASNNTLIVLMRSVPEGYLWQSESTDEGLTWSKPIKTPMEGYPASIVKLSDDRLLTVYGRRKIPMGIRAAVSSDNGKSWDIERELIIRNDGLGSPGDIGYPVACQLPDGSIVTVYYITTDNINTYIASSIFKIPY